MLVLSFKSVSYEMIGCENMIFMFALYACMRACMHATPTVQGCVYLDYNADGIMMMVMMMMLVMLMTPTPNKTR